MYVQEDKVHTQIFDNNDSGEKFGLSANEYKFARNSDAPRLVLRDCGLSRFSGTSLAPHNVTFHDCGFPSPLSILSSITWNLGPGNDNLILELMQWDAQIHGNIEAFDTWKATGACPYFSSPTPFRRAIYFLEDRKLWKRGKPKMSAKELLEALFKAVGCEIFYNGKQII